MESLSMTRRVLSITPFVFANGFGYVYLNQNPLSEPNYLPMYWIDHATPFMVWTVWPYTILLASILILPFMIKGREVFYKTIVAYVVAMSINFSFWIFYPTTYPRPPFSDPQGLSEKWYGLLIQADTPLNCLPSGHLTIPAVLLWGVLHRWPQHRWWVWPVFLIMGLSIVTTKQHYYIDYPAGLLTAAIGVAASLAYSRNGEKAVLGA